MCWHCPLQGQDENEFEGALTFLGVMQPMVLIKETSKYSHWEAGASGALDLSPNKKEQL